MPHEIDSFDHVFLRETDSAIADIRTSAGYGESPSLSGIFSLLGCPYMRTMEDIQTPRGRNDESGVLSACLARLLRAIATNPCRLEQDITSVLAGILRQSLWKSYLETESDTYTLAMGLLLYIEDYFPDFPLDVSIAEAVRDLLNAWLKPLEPWTSLPSVEDATTMMFGSAWLHLADTGDHLVGDVVFKERPPFLPGLCPAQQQTMSAPLPELGSLP